MNSISRLLAVLFLSLAGTGAAQPEGVFYEVFVRSFQDSDGDGVGDLRGAQGRLDYLQGLGVTGLWLMPIHPSPSYHGYDVTDYRSVHPDYGTLADLDAFIAAAHARGMEVILDLVVNHTSSQHPWFRAAARGEPGARRFYTFASENLGWRGLGGPAWHPLGPDYYLGLFWSEMPDLNHRNPAVTRELKDVARFWLARGVDGFRVDAIQHIVEKDGLIANTPENFAWVADFAAFVRRHGGYLVGETWTDTSTIARYHEIGLDASFNYPLFLALSTAVQRRNPVGLALALEQDARSYPAGAVRATFISNHDQLRPATALGLLRRDEARLKLAAGLLLALPGTPFLYYGEELGMPNGAGGADEEKRTPMRWDATAKAGFTTGTPWHPFSTDDPAISVAAQDAEPDSLLSYYRARIALRAAHPALSRGDLTVLESDAPDLLAFTRAAPEGVVLVLANFDDAPLLLSAAQLGALSGGRAQGARTLAGSEVAVLPLTPR